MPQVSDSTSAKVLTMEPGPRHPHRQRGCRRKGFDSVELVKALLSDFEGGCDGLFHGDLHAGNLYVDAEGRVVFFDFGVIGAVHPRPAGCCASGHCW